MLGTNERHVFVCKGEQQRVSGWSLTPILTHQYVTVAHFNALQRSPALHCVHKVLLLYAVYCKGVRPQTSPTNVWSKGVTVPAQSRAFSPIEWLLK